MLNNLYTPRLAAGAGAAASRADRRNDEFRAIRMQTGVVKHASGSAHVEIGRTKVVCSVFGPRATTDGSQYSDQGGLVCDVKFAPFACAGGRRERGERVEEDEHRVARRTRRVEL